MSLTGCAALTGCGVVGGASATRTPTSTATATFTLTPTVTSTPLPTATPTPEPTSTPLPSVARESYLGDALQMPQGRTLVVRVAGGGGASASATFRGKQHRMVADSGDFWAPLGAAADAPVGTYALIVTLFDASGNIVGSRTGSVAITHTNFPVERVDVPPSQDSLLSPEEVQKELNIRAGVFAKFTPEKLWSGPFILPANGPITSPFGIGRSYNGGPVTGFHSGTDFGVPIGTPVRAAATGRVAFAGPLTTRGNSVIIDHGASVFTAYHHLSRIEVTEGQMVTQGQIIGASGMTGLATGPHLHWELIVAGVNVDPVYWTYEGVAP